MTQAFEVSYTALETPSTARAQAVIVGRAIIAMVDSRHVRNAGSPMFFKRHEAGFTVCCESLQALKCLPQTYGSVLGHFGEFERGTAIAVPTGENFQALFAIAPSARSYSEATRRRLAVEVGGRLAQYLAQRMIAVRVRVPENCDSIVVTSACVHELESLPERFNGVFQRQAVSAV